jgi:hypothetical protein
MMVVRNLSIFGLTKTWCEKIIPLNSSYIKMAGGVYFIQIVSFGFSFFFFLSILFALCRFGNNSLVMLF